MSAYITCPKCWEDTLDVDTLRCDCGYGTQRIEPRKFDAEIEGASAKLAKIESYCRERLADPTDDGTKLVCEMVLQIVEGK